MIFRNHLYALHFMHFLYSNAMLCRFLHSILITIFLDGKYNNCSLQFVYLFHYNFYKKWLKVFLLLQLLAANVMHFSQIVVVKYCVCLSTKWNMWDSKYETYSISWAIFSKNSFLFLPIGLPAELINRVSNKTKHFNCRWRQLMYT